MRRLAGWPWTTSLPAGGGGGRCAHLSGKKKGEWIRLSC